MEAELFNNGYTIIQNILPTEDWCKLLDLFMKDLSVINPKLNKPVDPVELYRLVPGVDFPSFSTCNNKGVCGPMV